MICVKILFFLGLGFYFSKLFIKTGLFFFTIEKVCAKIRATVSKGCESPRSSLKYGIKFHNGG